MQTIQQDETVIRNGVDTAALMGAIQAIDKDPTLADFVFKSENKWLDGGHNRTTVRDFYGVGSDQAREVTFTMDADEPSVLLGLDRGANPVEYILHALAACVTTTTVYHAAARGIRIDRIESKLRGNLDLRGLLAMPGATRNGYEKIELTMKIEGSGTSEEMTEIVRFGRSHSPVFDIISNGTMIDVQVETF